MANEKWGLHMCACVWEARRGWMLGSQELELQAAVSHPKWVLGIELRSFIGAVHVRNEKLSLQCLSSTLKFLNTVINSEGPSAHLFGFPSRHFSILIYYTKNFLQDETKKILIVTTMRSNGSAHL